jgi:phage baseplate assembly protein W
MATYTGFSTIGINQRQEVVRAGAFGGVGSLTYQPTLGKKFVLTDEQLVIRDLINALSIQQGSKVGQPEYGTSLWSFLFEPSNDVTLQAIEDEIRRVISLDPRIVLNSLGVYDQDNGVMIQTEMSFNPFNNVYNGQFFLNRFDGSIQQINQ